MSNAVLPVIVGLLVGSSLIATMIVVGNSLHRYDGRVNALTFTNGNVEYFGQPGEIVPIEETNDSGGGVITVNMDAQQFWSAGPDDIIIIIDLDDEAD